MTTTKQPKPKAQYMPRELTPAQLAESLVISVGEARKILGADAKGLSDDEVALQILILHDLAPVLLNYKHFAK